MTEVTATHEVYIDGTRYPLLGEVQTRLVSGLPGKIVIGEATRADQIIASEWAQDDFRGGIGVEYLQEDVHTDRCYYATADIMEKRKVILPPQSVDITNPSSTGTEVYNFGIDYNSKLFTIWGAECYNYTPASSTWSAIVDTLNNTPTDGIIFNTYLLIAIGASNRYYYYDGVTMTEVAAEGASFFTIYDGKVLKIDSTGLIKSSLTGLDNSWTGRSVQLPIESGEVTGFLTWKNMNEDPTPYVCTKSGLWSIDMLSGKAYLTDLQVPHSTYAGKGSTAYSDSNLYFPNGMDLHRYGGQMISTVSPNQEDGLPNTLRGRITKLIPVHRWLLAIMENTEFVSTGNLDNTQVNSYEGFNDVIFDASIQGTSAVFQFSGSGFGILAVSNSDSTGSGWGNFSTLNDSPRFYYGANETAYYIHMPDNVINPLNDSDWRYEAEGELWTGWFDGGFGEIPKVATSIKFGAQQLNTTEEVDVYYAIDYDPVWTLLGTLTTDPTVLVTNPVTPSDGITFYQIRFKFVLRRANSVAADAAKTPVLLFFVLRYQRVLENKLSYTVNLDLTNTYAGVSPSQLRTNLLTSVNKVPLIQFIYRNHDFSTDTKYVRITGAAGQENTGNDLRSIWTVSLVEV